MNKLFKSINITNRRSKFDRMAINSIEEWIDIDISFDMEEKEGSTILRFTHGGWRAITDTFAGWQEG